MTSFFQPATQPKCTICPGLLAQGNGNDNGGRGPLVPTVTCKHGESLDYYAIILDESGSMESHRDDTLGSLRQFHRAQQAISSGKSKFIVRTFSDKGSVRFDGLLENKLDFAYNPTGGTALYDAIGACVNDTLNYLAKISDPACKPKDIYIIIITDGQENSSRTYNKTLIKDMIAKQKEADWKFIFLGANQDAVLSGGDIGVERGACLSYGQNKHDTPMAMLNVSRGIERQKMFGKGSQVAFTAEERATSNQYASASW